LKVQLKNNPNHQERIICRLKTLENPKSIKSTLLMTNHPQDTKMLWMRTKVSEIFLLGTGMQPMRNRGTTTICQTSGFEARKRRLSMSQNHDENS